jgi:hypothetical protein
MTMPVIMSGRGSDLSVGLLVSDARHRGESGDLARKLETGAGRAETRAGADPLASAAS